MVLGMDTAGGHSLAIAFLNANGAFEDPIGAARWWAAAQEGPRTALLLDPDGPKPRFNAELSAELRALHAAAIEAFGMPGSSTEPAMALSAGLARGSLQLKGDPPAMVFCAWDGQGAVLFPVAHAVASLLSARDERLRRCAREACSAYFWDGTKNRSRRWCRLRCMERVRAPRRRLQR
jgi:predicted RNA-binding Zn ribbon-like protein